MASHMSALTRTTIGDGNELNTFVLVGGDICHHAGELRPMEHLPLPDNLDHSMIGLQSLNSTECLTSVYTSIRPQHSRVKPFYTSAAGGFNHDSREMSKTLEKAAELDGNHDSIFTIITHDNSLIGVVDFFPLTTNKWKAKGGPRKAVGGS